MKISDLLTLDALVDVCGMLGFLLSGAMAIGSYAKSRLSVSASAAYIMDDSNATTRFITLRFAIGNRSSQPLGITSVDLRYRGEWLAPGFIPERILSHRNNRTSQRFDLVSTQFPINIPALEAQEVVLVYRAQCSKASRFRNLRPENHHQWKALRIRIHSVRGSKTVRCRAALETAEALLDVARQNNRF